MHARIQIYWCRSSIFRHLKLELLTQFPASNDEKYINVVYIWRKFVSFYGYVHWRMTTEISVMYGSEKVNGIWSLDFASWKWPSFNRHSKYKSHFHRIGASRFNTACCVNRMAVTVTGSAAKWVRQLGHVGYTHGQKKIRKILFFWTVKDEIYRKVKENCEKIVEDQGKMRFLRYS